MRFEVQKRNSRRAAGKHVTFAATTSTVGGRPSSLVSSRSMRFNLTSFSWPPTGAVMGLLCCSRREVNCFLMYMLAKGKSGAPREGSKRMAAFRRPAFASKIRSSNGSPCHQPDGSVAASRSPQTTTPFNCTGSLILIPLHEPSSRAACPFHTCSLPDSPLSALELPKKNSYKTTQTNLQSTLQVCFHHT